MNEPEATVNAEDLSFGECLRVLRVLVKEGYEVIKQTHGFALRYT